MCFKFCVATRMYSTLPHCAHHNKLEGLDPFWIEESALGVRMHGPNYMRSKQLYRTGFSTMAMATT